MENNSPDQAHPADARAALAAISADRERLAQRFRSQGPWAVPAQALAVALLVASPAAGMPMATVLAGVSAVALFGIDEVVRRRTGVRATTPAGPRGLAILVAILVVMVGFYVASLVLSFNDGTSGIVWTTAAAFVLVLLGGLLYDRVYLQEVRRAA